MNASLQRWRVGGLGGWRGKERVGRGRRDGRCGGGGRGSWKEGGGGELEADCQH